MIIIMYNNCIQLTLYGYDMIAIWLRLNSINHYIQRMNAIELSLII